MEPGTTDFSFFSMKFAILLGRHGGGTMAFQIFPGRAQTSFARYNKMMAPKSPYTICSSAMVSSKEFVTVGTFRPTVVD